MPFQVHLSSILWGGVISRLGIQYDPQKLKVVIDMPPPKTKKELQAFLGIINYLGKFSPRTVEVCELLRKLTSFKAEWMWNATYQKMFEETKAVIKEDACMKFYDKTKLLYIKTDVSGVGLEAALLQTRDNMSCHREEVPDNSILRPTAFASKILTGAEKRHSNIEGEALDIVCVPLKSSIIIALTGRQV